MISDNSNFTWVYDIRYIELVNGGYNHLITRRAALRTCVPSVNPILSPSIFSVTSFRRLGTRKKIKMRAIGQECSILVTDFWMVKLVKELQSRTTPSSIWVTDSGIVKFVKELQSWKVPSSIWVTDSGMVKFVKEQQSRKVPSSIWVTDSGIVKLVNELQ